MDMLLYMEIGDKLEFRRASSLWAVLSARYLPKGLVGEIQRDFSLTADEQAARLVAASGWVGRAAINAKSEAGIAIKGKRQWYCPDSEMEDAKI